MKLTTISVTYGRKLNMGNYNSVHSEVTLWADLDPDDEELGSIVALRQAARNNVMHELARVEPKLAAKVQDIFLGLPVEVQEEIKNAD